MISYNTTDITAKLQGTILSPSYDTEQLRKAAELDLSYKRLVKTVLHNEVKPSYYVKNTAVQSWEESKHSMLYSEWFSAISAYEKY